MLSLLKNPYQLPTGPCHIMSNNLFKLVWGIKRVNPQKNNKKESFSLIHPRNKYYTYIHLKLFSIIEVKKCFACIYNGRDQTICNHPTKNGILFHIRSNTYTIYDFVRILHVTKATNNNRYHFKFVVRIRYLHLTNEQSVIFFLLCNYLCSLVGSWSRWQYRQLLRGYKWLNKAYCQAYYYYLLLSIKLVSK